MQKAIEECDKDLKLARLDGNKSQLADAINNIGVISMIQGDYIKAEKNFLMALKIGQQVDGDDHLRTTIPMNNLSALYLNVNRIEEGRVLLDQSLKIVRDHFGDDPNKFMAGTLEVAITYDYSKKDYRQALAKAERLLGINTIVYGKESLRVAKTYLLLSKINERNGNSELKLLHAMRAADIYKNANNIWGYARALTDVGDALLLLGKPQQALAESQLAIRVIGTKFNVVTEDPIYVYEGLAKAHAALNNVDEALKNYTIAFALNDTKDYPDINVAYELSDRQGAILYKKGDYSVAAKVFAYMYKIHSKTTNPTEANLNTILVNLLSSYMKAKEYKKSIIYFDESLALQRKIYGANHLNVGLSLTVKGIAFGRLKKWKETIGAMREALPILMENNGPRSDKLLALNWLVIASDALGRKGDVRKYMEMQEALKEGDNIPGAP